MTDLIDAGVFAGLPRKHFAAIVIDPPWQYRAGGNRKPPYPTMPMREIMALPVAELAAEDCALFCWSTGPFLDATMRCLEEWRFTYKTIAFDWVKTWPRERGRLFVDWQESLDDSAAAGTGHWTMSNTEPCLLATRGRPKRKTTGIRQVIAHHRMEHSAKPEDARERIEKLVAGPYLDLFGRRPRRRWTVWGNQSRDFNFKPLVASPAKATAEAAQ